MLPHAEPVSVCNAALRQRYRPERLLAFHLLSLETRISIIACNIATNHQESKRSTRVSRNPAQLGVTVSQLLGCYLGGPRVSKQKVVTSPARGRRHDVVATANTSFVPSSALCSKPTCVWGLPMVMQGLHVNEYSGTYTDVIRKIKKRTFAAYVVAILIRIM